MNNTHHSKYYVPAGLPVPDADAIEHSQQLEKFIKNEIDSRKSIPFARFMELALYTPGLGYYSAGSRKLGKYGDFTTAPEISPLFSRCVAKQCEQVLMRLEENNILEFGAGTGKMASDILLELEQSNHLPENYYILETSADLRQQQKMTLEKHASHLTKLVQWLDQPPPKNFEGVILANELLDAMPVHLFQIRGNIANELHVTLANDQFVFKEGETDDAYLQDRISKIAKNLPDNYLSEINIAAEAWVRSTQSFLKKGLILIIDYGHAEYEYYHHQRSSGTLMCHYRHHTHIDPLVLVGLQDITAHVNFTAIAERADDCGLDVSGYTTQALFLFGCGLEAMTQSLMDQSLANQALIQQLETGQQIKKLTLPSEMGERFKVLALTKQLNFDLVGFRLADQRARLFPAQ
ncbi:MAG: SAM-dependent methyltransferase [Gammaproteobacteria bacterium]|nr:SAM-dependent methyltransferase [Gammaproteobacteria bacterium]